MKRSAVSIPSNIAEGAERESDREFRRFLAIAVAITLIHRFSHRSFGNRLLGFCAVVAAVGLLVALAVPRLVT